MSGITLSKKHGVNPTILVCPICYAETNGLALMGRLPGDAEAPRYSLDREYCKNCKDVLATGGIIMIEVEDGQEDKLAPGQAPKRTGVCIGINRQALRDSLEEGAPEIPDNTPAVYMERRTIIKMMGEELYSRITSQPVHEQPK